MAAKRGYTIEQRSQKSRDSCRDWYKKHDGAGYAKRIREKLRMEFISEFGSKCECCGESEYAFLTIEHKGDWGGEHRKKKPCTHQQLTDAKKQGWPRDRYGLLCFNCNRASFGGLTCPHKETK